jgi:predicted metal-dependent hydrolase
MEKTIEYRLDGKKYKVLIIKKNNKNTYLRVKDDLTITITTNYLTTKREIKRLLDENVTFLKKVLKKVKNKQEKESQFYYLGNKYDIIILPSKNIEIDQNKIYAPNIESVDKWLKKQIKEVFKNRLEYNYNLFEENIPFPKLKIRAMKTRWGVCNKRDNSVTLNSKLIRYTLHEIDYVIIHELSHFVHFDHSKKFWKTVEKYMPNYKQSVKVLKE